MLANNYGYGDASPDVAAANEGGSGGAPLQLGDELNNLTLGDNGSRAQARRSSYQIPPPGFLDGGGVASNTAGGGPIGPRRASIQFGGNLGAGYGGLLQPGAEGLSYEQDKYGYGNAAPDIAQHNNDIAQYGYGDASPNRRSPMAEGVRRASIQFGDMPETSGGGGGGRRASWFAGDAAAAGGGAADGSSLQRALHRSKSDVPAFGDYGEDTLRMAMQADTQNGSSLRRAMDNSARPPADLPAYGRSYAHHRRASGSHSRYQGNTGGGYYPGGEMPDVVYHVKFKRNQNSYILGPRIATDLEVGTYVKVEADRGEDLGIVVGKIPFEKYKPPARRASLGGPPTGTVLRKVIRLARRDEVDLLTMKRQEESELLEICREKAYERGLPMMVVDAEYQFDRHKLTFFFQAETRIDFRDLVRELYTMTGTRIWMEQINGFTGCPTGPETPDTSTEIDNSTPIIAPMSEYTN